jgi:hypothetical protein
MIIHNDFKQNTLEWHMARSGIPTASEFDNLLTPEFKIRTGEMPKSYLFKKVAEAWQGGPLPSKSSYEMEQGKILEEDAIPWFSLEYDVAIQRVGFITTDDGRMGCSPDGLIGEDSGLEIKCPEAHTHTSYLLTEDLPKAYACQVHGSMFVSGRPEWKFVSYRNHFPQLVLTIERDEEIQEKIQEAVGQFLEHFDDAMRQMTEKNGGPSYRLKPLAAASVAPAPRPAAKTYDLHRDEVTP